jgi:hypothetical protein
MWFVVMLVSKVRKPDITRHLEIASAVDRLWGLLLVFLAYILGAIGLTAALPLALVGAALCVVILVVAAARSWWRRREAVPPPLAGLNPAEDPSRRAEREAIQRQARQVGTTFRVMARVNGIQGTPGDVRLAWQAQYLAPLQSRLETYRHTWPATLPNKRSFVPADTPVRPEWLEEMAREADVIVWQLDHEG